LPDDLKYYNAENGATIELYKLEIGYDNLAVDEVLRKILPDSIKEIPSSFEQAGHLAHLNLREEALPFKQVIGQVIIDKNPHIKTVINKVGNIETEFRTFPIELLAGENNFHVSLKESNAKFQFDFDKVYWNSRLQMEHSRVISLIKGSCKKENIDINNKKDKHNSNLVPRDRIVADMMAGIGPFAVPLAKERVKVYANDLNPESYKYLVSNTKLNQCENFLESFNLDGRMFILELIEREIKFNEVLMNLPQSATDFLDVFIGLGQRIGPSFNESLLPRIHVYAFSTASDPVADIVDRVAGVMKCDPSALNFNGSDNIPKNMEESVSFPCWGHIVRDVSPKKMMICLSFRLPLSVALADPIVHVVEENAKKKIRIN
jgi:tRNA (guanine37-N1)-methyltransferase